MIALLEQIFDKGGLIMRIMPFMKRKKGVQFAGIGLDTGGGGGGGSYVLPTATRTRLGGVKVGTGLEVAEDGTLSTSGGGGGQSDTYTADEVEVGTWFGSPLYRKAYNGAIPSAGVPCITFDGYNKAVFAYGMFKHSEFTDCRMIGADQINFSGNGVTITNAPSNYSTMSVVVYYIKNS